MGTLLAEDILKGARDILRDATNTTANPYRWDNDHLLRHASRGQREIVRLLPSANPIREALKLSAGKTFQDLLDSQSFQILRVIRNMGADGKTPGRAIKRMNVADLDDQVPGWHNGRLSSVIEVWAQELEERKCFYAFPRPPAQGPDVWVEVLHSRAPDALLTLNDSLGVDDVYEYPLSILTAGFALQEDTKSANFSIGQALEGRGYSMLQGSFTAQQATQGVKAG